MSSDAKPSILIEFQYDIIEIPLDDTVGYSAPEETPDSMKLILPLQCRKCKHISINADSDLEIYNIDNTRDMGPDIQYSAKGEGISCDNCDNPFYFEIDVSTYAASWGVDSHEFKGCDLVVIGSLEHVLSHYYNQIVNLKGPPDDFADPEEIILERKEEEEKKGSHVGYALIVEGDDDQLIWTALLQNRSIEPRERGIVIIRGPRSGGLQEAINVLLIAKQILIKSEKKLVVDSDANKAKIESELKKHNLIPSEYHILALKEIESYLMDPETISLVTGIDSTLIKMVMDSIPREGKEKLDQLFLKLNLPKPTGQIKYLLARRLTKIPAEIESILLEIENRIN